MNLNEAIIFLEKKGFVVLTSEGFIPDSYYRSEVWNKKKCIFKGNNANELIKFAEDVKNE